jgi:hypothetical protein
MAIRAVVTIGLLLALTASVHGQIFGAAIDGAQEDPPVSTTGTGTGVAVYNGATDRLNISMTFSGLIGTTLDSHIHCCFGEPGDPPGRNSGVAVGFTPHGFPLGVTSGTFSASIDLSNPANYTAAFLTEGGGTAAGARNMLLAGMDQSPNAGGAYFNIHTTFRQGGEIRGDISRVPEPSSFVLMLCAASAVAGTMRPRRQLPGV